jgi:hypothetical protein
MTTPTQVLEKILAKSVWVGNCHIWTGCVNGSGYGRIGYNYEVWLVHRLVYILTCKETDLDILHSCDNPPCWNIEHLFEGTDCDNVSDMVNKNRNAYGIRNGMAKLTEEQVLEIRQDYRPWINSQRILARKYGVTQHSIQSILDGCAWKHVVV